MQLPDLWQWNQGSLVEKNYPINKSVEATQPV